MRSLEFLNRIDLKEEKNGWCFWRQMSPTNCCKIIGLDEEVKGASSAVQLEQLLFLNVQDWFVLTGNDYRDKPLKMKIFSWFDWWESDQRINWEGKMNNLILWTCRRSKSVKLKYNGNVFRIFIHHDLVLSQTNDGIASLVMMMIWSRNQSSDTEHGGFYLNEHISYCVLFPRHRN